ncbi:hypothetical protein D3C84_305910 [compost metagenome]
MFDGDLAPAAFQVLFEFVSFYVLGKNLLGRQRGASNGMGVGHIGRPPAQLDTEPGEFELATGQVSSTLCEGAG